MARSLKKGPYVDLHLLKKVDAARAMINAQLRLGLAVLPFCLILLA